MKKVLYIDILSPSGHKNYNEGILRILSRSYQVDVCMRKDLRQRINNNYYNNCYDLNERLFRDIIASKISSRFFIGVLWRINLFKWILSTYRKIIKSYDIIFFSSAEPLSISMASLITTSPFSFVDHGICKVTTSRSIRFYYKYLLSCRANVCVMEPFIKEKLSRYGISNVSVVYHPLPIITVEQKKQRDILTIFAPSGGNCPNFISQLITEYQKIPNGVKIVIRSSSVSFNNDRLEVYNKTLDGSSYKKIFSTSDVILLPYGPIYNYRTSALLFEALCYKKLVFILGNNTLTHYAFKYPSVVKSFKAIDDLMLLASNIEYVADDEFSKIKSDYSDDVILQQLNCISSYGK